MTQTEIAVKMVLDRWHGSIANFDKHLQDLTDDDLQRDIAPGSNRGLYLLGHLIAVHDDMLILLGMGEKLFPELHEPFIAKADKHTPIVPTAAELRAKWAKHNTFLQEKMWETTTADWFSKHTAVSEADFAQEPHRNKLNIIITRTSHLQYHTGQLVLLKNHGANHFQYNFHTSLAPEAVFAQLTDPRNWWVDVFGETITGESVNIGDVFSFLAGGGMHHSKQQLIEKIPSRKLTWLVNESNLTFLQNPSEWTGTQFGFELLPTTGGTTVMFWHQGLTPAIECYPNCSDGWTQYLQKLEQKLNRDN